MQCGINSFVNRMELRILLILRFQVNDIKTILGHYRLGTVNSNTVNSKFHLISFSQVFLPDYHFMFKMHGYFENG